MSTTLPEIDLDALLVSQCHESGGVYGLWLHVMLLSVYEFIKGKYSTGPAAAFIFDKENPFFDFVCDQMGYEPNNLRKRIRGAAERAKGNE